MMECIIWEFDNGFASLLEGTPPSALAMRYESLRDHVSKWPRSSKLFVRTALDKIRNDYLRLLSTQNIPAN